jgi:hypothetical protein
MFADLEKNVSLKEESAGQKPAFDPSGLRTSRLREIISDINADLDASPPENRHALLLTLASVACELATREISSTPVSDAGRLTKQAGDPKVDPSP